MLLTRFTHACVRLEDDRGVLVIDPGIWSEPAALAGADAVLITHEHVDHVDVLRLRGLGAPVHAPSGAVIPGLDVVAVHAGEVFTAAGMPVQAVGGEHAVVHGDGPGCANLGYVVEDRVYHPVTRCMFPRRTCRRCACRCRRPGCAPPTRSTSSARSPHGWRSPSTTGRSTTAA